MCVCVFKLCVKCKENTEHSSCDRVSVSTEEGDLATLTPQVVD